MFTNEAIKAYFFYVTANNRKPPGAKIETKASFP